MKNAVFAASAVAMLALSVLALPAGSGQKLGCGPVISVQDPELRAHFAKLAAAPSTSTAKICALDTAQLHLTFDFE